MQNSASRATIAKPHERGVEGFYATGITGFHDYHGGYLNFGLWDRDGLTYVEAAENLVHRMGTLLGLDAKSELLDVGCGMGAQDVYLTRTFSPAAITAMDVTFKHIERARERADRAGIPMGRLRFKHGSGTALPFTEPTFSHVLSIEAPEHFHTREDFFHEAYRALRPNGVIALADYTLAREPANLVEWLIVKAASWLWHMPAANIYTNEVYAAKMKNAGFKNVTIENVGKYTIPGYYFEHQRPEARKEVVRVRGWFMGVVGGWLIDYGVYKAFTSGVCEYVLVRAEK